MYLILSSIVATEMLTDDGVVDMDDTDVTSLGVNDNSLVRLVTSLLANDISPFH